MVLKPLKRPSQVAVSPCLIVCFSVWEVPLTEPPPLPNGSKYLFTCITCESLGSSSWRWPYEYLIISLGRHISGAVPKERQRDKHPIAFPPWDRNWQSVHLSGGSQTKTRATYSCPSLTETLWIHLPALMMGTYYF